MLVIIISLIVKKTERVYKGTQCHIVSFPESTLLIEIWTKYVNVQ